MEKDRRLAKRVSFKILNTFSCAIFSSTTYFTSLIVIQTCCLSNRMQSIHFVPLRQNWQQPCTLIHESKYYLQKVTFNVVSENVIPEA